MKKKPVEPVVKIEIKKSFFQKYKLAIIPMLLGFGLYFNTLHHGFVLDDGLIVQDTYINQGLKNIPGLFTQKTLPEVGNIKPYRPITSLSFALDYSFFNKGDQTSLASNMHKLNVFYYVLALFFTFVFIKKLFNSTIIAVAISVVFAVHPIHTEVVANIKSRDEILAYLFGLLSLILYLKFLEIKNKKWLLASLFFYFIAILSKESAILFIAIFPFLKYYKSDATTINWSVFKDLRFFIIPAVLYLLLQKIILGSNFMPRMTAIDNMLVGITNSQDNLATRFYMVGLYLYKMIFPHPLIYDYSIDYLTTKTFASYQVWLSIVAIISLIYFIIKGIVTKNKIVFGLVFMAIMFTLTCNLFMPIGTTFAERLTFTPSLGFAIALVFLIVALLKKIKLNPTAVLYVLLPVLLLYSYKTYTRNENWKDNETLFTHDYNNSAKSLRIQNNFASIFYQKAKLEKDTIQRNKLFVKSIEILDKITNKYNKYIEAFIQKGIIYLELKDCTNSISNLETARKTAKYNSLIESNLGISYINCGRSKEALPIFLYLLEQDPPNKKSYLKNIGVSYYNIKNIDSASYYFNKLKQEYPEEEQVDAYLQLVSNTKSKNAQTQQNPVAQTTFQNIDNEFNQANQFYEKGNKKKAETILKNCIKLNPNHALSYALLGIIADDKLDYNNAVLYYKKSISANPNDYRIYFNLGNTYLKMNKEKLGIQSYEKSITVMPTYKNPYQALSIYYKSKNDTEKSEYYAKKFQELN